MSWIAAKLARLFLVFGGLSALALVIGVVSYIFGEREFLIIGDRGERGSFGTFAWQFTAIWLGCWLLWRVCLAYVFRYGDERSVAGALGWQEDYDARKAEDQWLARPVVGRCRACGEEFRSWDDGLDHVEDQCGGNMMREEARALLEPIERRN